MKSFVIIPSKDIMQKIIIIIIFKSDDFFKNRSDLDLVMKNATPDVKDLLKALQLTIEFEVQLAKRYERLVSMN